MLYNTIAVLLLFGFTNPIQAARILGVIPTPAYSHQSVFQPIWRALAERGHELVVVTANPMNDASLPNLKEIDISFSYEIKDQQLMSVIKDKDVGLAMFQAVSNITMAVVISQLKNERLQNLIHDNSIDFDLVMFEYLLPAFGAFAYKYKCPSIGLLSLELLPHQNELLGNPQHSSVTPLLFLPVYKDMSFYKRLQSAFLYLIAPTIDWYFFEREFNKIIAKYFGEEYPPVMSYLRNVDMVFTNTNNVLKIPTPVAPNVIEFNGGVHIKAPKPLPSDIAEFLNSSKTGVVYFSLGSSIKSEFVNDELKSVILETLTTLPYDVLWKFEDDIVKDNPKIKILKWAPQQDILRHPNVKLFITQCGLQSLEEALYGHVPVIGLPFFGDQLRNAKIIEYLGMGKSFNHEELEVSAFKKAIIDVASDTKYKKTMMELAKRSRDVPMNGVDSVVWWTEYVIRNNGAKHLRSALIDLPMYQYYMLDVYGCFALVILITVYVVFKLFKLLSSWCNLCKSKKVKTQ